jgi:hypothetical protein
MNDTTVHQAAPEVATGTRPSLVKVIRDQRKTLWVALAMMVAALWLGQLDRWALAGCVAAGVFLGLCNHLATEYWLLKLISSGEKPTRNKMIASTIVRLVVLTVVAVGIAVMFWPDGIGLLLGLAIFRLVALTMTSITLLKELKES